MMKTIPQEFLMEDGLVQLIDGFTEKGGVQENFVKKLFRVKSSALNSWGEGGCSREFCEKADRKGG